VGLVYDPRGLPRVTTVRPGVLQEVTSLGVERGSGDGQMRRESVAAWPNSAAREEEERANMWPGREKAVSPGGANRRRKRIRVKAPWDKRACQASVGGGSPVRGMGQRGGLVRLGQNQRRD
jgi:hypothetical protein